MNYQQPIAVPVPVKATIVPIEPTANSFSRQTHGHGHTGSITRDISSFIGDAEIKALQSQGFTRGLAESLADMKTSFPLRIWVVDNSGSMQKTDGHRIISTRSKNDLKIVGCTRWEEIKEAVNYHTQMSALLEAPTSFRLLNNPGIGVGPNSQQFDIAQMGKENIPTEVANANEIMTRTRPGGVTPLTEHIQEINATILSLKPELEAAGKRVAVIIASDGLPTDSYGNASQTINNQFVQSLRMLEGLPVWLVIRLCTDDDEVVDFYNGLDDQLELSMDVLDDFVGEAKEVYEHNKWLNYALPLHRMREMGYHDRVFDMLDERTLTKGELRDFCRLLFGMNDFDGVADPSNDWPSFLADVKRLLDKEELQYNPVKQQTTPWINLKKLNKIYGDGSGCAIM
eukprot:CAMPEP_0194083104 /NCGR_PEP_ID=MMETSP0149-20130528/8446_1 /TAXON_ID=122233 /ORGANISM="Chaetoceros debilis, Strain MM31A-1" /LENGTH=398 /DNA_ID=CAMNT_0038765435 /DNA_START=59 /DNA_END=1255 /DNA_ORIENTATION=+